MAAVSCCRSPRLDRLTTPRLHIIFRAHRSLECDVWPRSIDRSCVAPMVKLGCPRFWVSKERFASKFSIEPIPSRASWCARESSSRDHGDIPVYKKRRNERARGRWDLCGYYAIGCRRYTDCLVALRRDSEQTNRCSALSFIGLSPMLIDSRNRFTSFSTPRPVCFDFGGVRIDLRGIVGLRACKRRSL